MDTIKLLLLAFIALSAVYESQATCVSEYYDRMNDPGTSFVSCPSDYSYGGSDGFECYSYCPDGYSTDTSDSDICYQSCPSDFPSDSDVCIVENYQPRSPFSYGEEVICTDFEHPITCRGESYCSCPQGMQPDPHDCTICSPPCPDGMTAGMFEGIYSCQRASTNKAIVSAVCSDSSDEQASDGYCFPACPNGYYSGGGQWCSKGCDIGLHLCGPLCTGTSTTCSSLEGFITSGSFYSQSHNCKHQSSSSFSFSTDSSSSTEDENGSDTDEDDDDVDGDDDIDVDGGFDIP